MAQKLVQTSNCDSCKDLGLGDVSAEYRHTVSIDGGPEKNMDLCPRCEVGDFEHLVSVYRNQAQVPPSPQMQERLVTKAKAPKTPKAAVVKVEPERLPEPVEEAPSELAQANVSKVPVVCPLDHPGTKEGPKEVPYANRSSHSVMVHDRDVWEIPWGDPYGILKEPCLAHQECIDGNYRCTKPNGVTNHINRCTKLKRIDT